MVIDILMSALYLVLLIVTTIIWYCYHKSDEQRYWLTLSLTTLCGIFNVFNHLPYIAMAYLDDPYHATSIFIYYTFIMIGLLILTYVLYFNDANHPCGHLGLLLYFLPIDESISRAQNQLFSIHQIVIIFVGAVTAYYTIFKKANSHTKATNRVSPSH